MGKKGLEKTNVMRILDQKKIPYTAHTYPHGDDPMFSAHRSRCSRRWLRVVPVRISMSL